MRQEELCDIYFENSFVYFQMNNLKTRNYWKSAYLEHFTCALGKKWINKGILFIGWIQILSHNKNNIKVSEKSVKNFSDAHSSLRTFVCLVNSVQKL